MPAAALATDTLDPRIKLWPGYLFLVASPVNKLLRYAKHVLFKLGQDAFRKWTHHDCGGQEQAVQHAREFGKLVSKVLIAFDSSRNKADRFEVLAKYGGVKHKRTVPETREALEIHICHGRSVQIEDGVKAAIGKLTVDGGGKPPEASGPVDKQPVGGEGKPPDTDRPKEQPKCETEKEEAPAAGGEVLEEGVFVQGAKYMAVFCGGSSRIVKEFANETAARDWMDAMSDLRKKNQLNKALEPLETATATCKKTLQSIKPLN